MRFAVRPTISAITRATLGHFLRAIRCTKQIDLQMQTLVTAELVFDRTTRQGEETESDTS